MTEVINQNIPSEAGETQELNKFQKALQAFCGWFGYGIYGRNSSKKRKKIFFDIITYIILLAGAFTMVYPLWWMFAASFATNDMVLLETVWWPSSTVSEVFSAFYNYSTSFTVLDNMWNVEFSLLRSILNTLIYSLVPVTIGVIVSAAAAFAFAKLDFKGKNFVFFYCLAAIMVPFPSIMIAQYCFYDSLNWVDGPLAMIIPGCFGAILTAFFIRQYLYGLPTAIIEAAKIDGAGYWRIFWTFIIPLAKPAIMAQFILSFMGSWNNFLAPQLFVRANEWKPLTIAVSEIGSSGRIDPQPITMAASVIAIVPILVLFAVFQKTIIGSIMMTGSKE